MKNMHVLNFALVLPLFCVACQSKPNKLVEVMLQSKTEEARGYCLDIAGGKGATAPLDKGLQAHTCYNYTGSILEDQGFDAALISKGQFRISYFDVCMSASSFVKGSTLSLEKCDQSDSQKFLLKPNGHLVIQKSPELCVTVSNTEKKEGRGGSPVHVMRPISLEPCDESKNTYQTWSVNELNRE